jgi:GTP-binding protein
MGDRRFFLLFGGCEGMGTRFPREGAWRLGPVPPADAPSGYLKPMLPQVIIIGRPNVGKSTLFNRLVGKKLALVDDQPGVTRDRRYGEAHLLGLDFTIVDTAGWEDLDPTPARPDADADRGQRDRRRCGAVRVRSRAGVTPLDEEIARWLRAQDVPVILLANKAEGKAGDAGLFDAFALGFGEPIAFSAEHGTGMADLFEALLPHVERDQDEFEPEPIEEEDEEALNRAPLKLAIVGRPNAGKSTLINAMLGEDRLLTGPEAGITRDSIAVDWTWTDPENGDLRPVRLIDTAGMRKKAQVTEKLEKMSVADARHAIDFAEVVVLLLDATRGLEHQDLKIASMVLEEGRALMIAVNKWDVEGRRRCSTASAARWTKVWPGEGPAPAHRLGPHGQGARRADRRRLRDPRRMVQARLHRPAQPLVRQGAGQQSAPAPGGKRIKLRYITQAKTRPPGFVLFGTRLDDLPTSYQRYLVNGIRRELGFDAVPVRLTLRSAKNPFAPKK